MNVHPIPLNKKEKLSFESAGWYLIFGLIPFGSSILGFPILLINRIVNFIKNKFRFETLKNNPLLAWINNILFIMLFSVMLISGCFSIKPSVSLPLAFGAGLLIFVFIFGGQQFGRTNKLIENHYLPVLAVSSVIATVIALIRFFMQRPDRAVNLFCDANGLGTVLIIVSAFTIGYLIRRGKKWPYFIIPYLGIIIPLLLVSKTRAAWIGFIAMLSTISLFNKKTLIVLLIVILIAGTIITGSPVLQNRFNSIFSLEENFNRICIWQSTIRMIKDHPWLGVGGGLYSTYFPHYLMPNAPEKTAVWSHNIFLEFAVEFGIIAALIFFVIVCLILFMGFSIAKTGNPIYQATLAAFIGVMVQQQVDLPAWRFDLGGAFWLLFGLIIGYYQYEKTIVKSKSQ